MKQVVELGKADDTAAFGAKAVGLGEAIREGLPVPPGIALAGPIVEDIAAGKEKALERLARAAGSLKGPFAVRSSAIDEDGADASFAGQHLTLLNVQTAADLPAAVREIWWSANSDSAITYRKRVGLFTRPSVGVVVQSLLDPEVAGVMFTANPVTGADERVVEAAWGLGEAVVAGLVIPDHFRIARTGEVVERKAGRKRVAVRPLPAGGTFEEAVPPARAGQLCLEDDQLADLNELAARCEAVYGEGRDIEWAVAAGQLYLLQCRAVTTKPSGERAAPRDTTSPGPIEALHRVPLFAGLDRKEVEEVAGILKERRFAQGETVIMEGAEGAAFFLIQSGEAVVSTGGIERARLGPGDYFGEVALIDEGPRSATVIAATDLLCYGLTLWEFRPLVHANSDLAWSLLQTLAKRLRAAQQT